MTKAADPYGVKPWERVVDGFTAFWGALLGVPSVIDRPLTSRSGREMGATNFSSRSYSSSAWRRERNYQRARRAFVNDELGSIPAIVREKALLKLSPEHYVDWLLTVDPDLGGLRPLDLIRNGGVRSVLQRLDAMPGRDQTKRCDRCGQPLPKGFAGPKC